MWFRKWLVIVAAALVKPTMVTASAPNLTTFPRNITLRVAMAGPRPNCMTAEDGSKIGFQPDLLNEIKKNAKRDGVNLFLELDTVDEYNFIDSFDLVAKDCLNSSAIINKTQCGQYDLLASPLLASPRRYKRADLTPTFQQEYTAALQYNQAPQPHYSTFAELERANGTVCLSPKGLLYKNFFKRYPGLEDHAHLCEGPFATPTGCFVPLKAGKCSLALGLFSTLKYATLQDPSLSLIKDGVDKNYKVWFMPYRLDAEVRSLVKKWIYRAVSDGKVDELFSKHYESQMCPLGYAGENCTAPCDPSHGRADHLRNCICDSTRFTGDDCATEAIADTGSLPYYQLVIGYCMFGINFLLVVGCATWLFIYRNTRHIKRAQKGLMYLVLLGCLISSSTILALMVEAGPGSSHNYCTAIPWLYSVGFCVTFGTLFAKIYRVHKVVSNAMRMRRVTVTTLSALRWIALVLCVDMSILIAWQVEDPLEWTRTVTNQDKFGFELASVGMCFSENWAWFAGAIGLFHFLLVATASYMCVAARKMPNDLSGVRGISIAMISNFQIFLVAIPVLFLIGSDPNISFFLRSAIIWINDFAVVLAIFGDLMYMKTTAKISDGTRTLKISGLNSSAGLKSSGLSSAGSSGIPDIRRTAHRKNQGSTGVRAQAVSKICQASTNCREGTEREEEPSDKKKTTT